MTRQTFANCWYADALPSGEFAVLSRDGATVHTHLGDIPTQSGNAPGWVRITNAGGFALAGQGTNASNVPVWTQALGWTPIPDVACGTSPVLYDPTGLLRISHCGAVGANGWRYWGTLGPDDVQPRAITGDETKVSSFGLDEWTYLGDSLWIGQGQSGGLLVRDGDALRVVNMDGPEALRANRAGESVALAYYLEGASPTAVLIHTTMTELRALPIYQPPIDPVVIPEIPPFDHPVLVCVFADDGTSGASPFPGRFDESDNPTVAPNERVCWLHDGPDYKKPPAQLRSWDQVWLECYRLKSETLDESIHRWLANAANLVADWKGTIGIVPMMYGQGGAPPNELWTVQDVIDATEAAVEMADSLTRIEVVAPFAYNRANGILAHPELQELWRRIKAASTAIPTFPPIGGAAPIVSSGGSILMAEIKGVIQHYGKQNTINGKVTLIANPQTGDVWSAQPDGSLQTRPKGTVGVYEQFKLDGQIATANSGVLNSYVATDVTGL